MGNGKRERGGGKAHRGANHAAIHPSGGKPKWDWVSLKAEFFTSTFKEFPTVVDFLRAKGIPESTGRKQVSGWNAERDAVLQRAATKAVTKYVNRVAEIRDRHAKIAAAMTQMAFSDLLECDKNGKPISPPRLRKNLTANELIRILKDGSALELRVLNLDRTIADDQYNAAPDKLTPMPSDPDAEPEARMNVNQKLRRVLEKPKLRAAADVLLDGLGDVAPEVTDDGE